MKFTTAGNLPKVRKAAKPHVCGGCSAKIRLNEYYACQAHAHGEVFRSAYHSEKLCLHFGGCGDDLRDPACLDAMGSTPVMFSTSA